MFFYFQVKLLGSQRRKKNPYRGSGGGGGGRRGGGGGGTGDDSRREENNEIKQIYQKVQRKTNQALKQNDFSYAASLAASFTISKSSVNDLTALLIAGAKAFQEGKKREWKPDPSNLATTAIKDAQEKIGLKLSKPRSALFNEILSANLRDVNKKRGKYP